MIDLTKVTDLEFEDINGWDAPDFVDVYISAASIQNEDGSWRTATEEELDEINENTDFVYNNLINQIN